MELLFEPPLSFQDDLVPAGTRLVGWAALVHALGLEAPVRQPSCISDSHVRGSQRTENGWRVFDKRYAPGNEFADHLGFALRHEAIDLLILKRAFEAVPAANLEDFIKSAPTGALTRRAWFFYEHLTGKHLDMEDAPTVAAIPALNPKAYFTGKPRLSRRHRVRDNLLGSGSYCPIIRRTETLEKFVEAGLSQKAAETMSRTGAHLAARAARFLLLADSRASFQIEGERPPRNRLERWGRAVLQAGENKLGMDELNRLHGVLIEDTRFIEAGLRPDGVFVGERDHNGDPLPEFIGARASDLESLMTGLLTANERMRESGLDAVLQATATAFGFVYVHPYQDGNGRFHRCLIHHVLAERGYTPPGMVFPVSSVMLDRIDDYGQTLKNHSGPLMDFIEWRPTPDRNVEVLNDTADLYRYFDCTETAEFLYACVERTVEHDLPNEIDYLRHHDEAQRRIMETVEMPDRLAQNLIMFMHQNGGAIPKRRREKEFAALTNEEAAQIETIYNDVFDDGVFNDDGEAQPWKKENKLSFQDNEHQEPSHEPDGLLTLRKPDDWHVHLRDGDMLAFAADYTARQFARAIVMPNLAPPVTTAAAADAYRTRILDVLPAGRRFTPLMTAYLTDEIDPAEVVTGFEDGVFTACKLYPAGATTNSADGVTDVRKIWPVLERMEAIGMPLLVHGEVVSPDIDIFDREAVFLERVMTPVLADFPGLKVVLEHITTEDSVRFVEATELNVAATITAHHLRIDRNAMFEGGLRPHAYCLPVAKRRHHKEVLRKAATSGNPRFFLGTDTAPHQKHEKESACGCAGIFSAPTALESYAQTFEEEGALDRLEAFASEFGPRFYGLPLNEGTVTLRREAQDVPEQMGDDNVHVVPFHAGEALAWRFAGRTNQTADEEIT